MTRRLVASAALLAAFVAFLSPATAAPDKAMCAVCSVFGETKTEKVRAEITHEGHTYYFCADDCKGKFEAEPAVFMTPVLPRPVPAVAFETMEGEKRTLGDYDGRVVLVDFWATWCKPCEKLMPKLVELHDEFGGNGFDILGVSIDEPKDREARIRKFVKKHKVSYPILVDATATPAWEAFHVKAIPSAFLVDASGNIVAQWRGAVDHDAVRAAVAKLLGGETPVEG